jgi:hypothetical protein
MHACMHIVGEPGTGAPALALHGKLSRVWPSVKATYASHARAPRFLQCINNGCQRERRATCTARLPSFYRLQWHAFVFVGGDALRTPVLACPRFPMPRVASQAQPWHRRGFPGYALLQRRLVCRQAARPIRAAHHSSDRAEFEGGQARRFPSATYITGSRDPVPRLYKLAACFRRTSLDRSPEDGQFSQTGRAPAPLPRPTRGSDARPPTCRSCGWARVRVRCGHGLSPVNTADWMWCMRWAARVAQLPRPTSFPSLTLALEQEQ